MVMEFTSKISTMILWSIRMTGLKAESLMKSPIGGRTDRMLRFESAILSRMLEMVYSSVFGIIMEKILMTPLASKSIGLRSVRVQMIG